MRRTSVLTGRDHVGIVSRTIRGCPGHSRTHGYDLEMVDGDPDQVTACPFCLMVREGLPAHYLVEGPEWFVILERQPLSLGHCMVISRQHARTVYELDAQSYRAIVDIARRLAPGLQSALGVQGVGFVASGAGLPHAHLHLIPMNDEAVLLKPSPYLVPDDVLAEQARVLRARLGFEDMHIEDTGA